MDRNVVVIGGSAGALRAIRRIVARLPPRLDAAVLVVIHYPSDYPSVLAAILDRAGPLPASKVEDEVPLRPAWIGVASPGRHLVVRESTVRCEMGPRENAQRPAIDVLFRSAARTHRDRTIAVLVSGTLDDGTAGLRDVLALGGRSIVQRPTDAEFDAMPRSAIENGFANEILDADEIGQRLDELVSTAGTQRHLQVDGAPEPVQTRLSCPECGGPLAEYLQEPPAFRCRIGHAYTIGSLAEATHHAGETSLWSALRLHDERAEVVGRLYERAVARNDLEAAATYTRLADEAKTLATRIRAILSREPFD